VHSLSYRNNLVYVCLVLDEEISFPTYLGDSIRVRVVRQGTAPMTDEQKARARVATRELRLGASWNFEPVVFAVQRLHHALAHRDLMMGSHGDGVLELRPFLDACLEEIAVALEAGRLLVTEGAFPLLAMQPEHALTLTEPSLSIEPPLPPIARRRPDDKLTFFEVRFVDEVGQAIGGLEVELSAGALVEAVTTNPAGVAEVTDVTSMQGAVQVVSVSALDDILEPRWQARRSGSEPSGKNTKSLALTGARIAGVELKPAVPNTVVITPPVGKLFVELWDKTGRVRHTETEYSISGSESFSGMTDIEGRLLHEGVFPGDYELKLTLQDQAVTCPLLVLDKNASGPQVRRLGSIPFVQLARMFGMLFETDKNFLLPSALPSLREIRQLYEASNPSELLIVGHTDTTGDPSHNDTLSLERADAVAAYLLDDADAWLARYEPGVAETKRWGDREDVLMLTAMPDFPTRPAEEDAVRWFQRTRNLEMDGVAGPKTREQLVKEYMRLDGVSLADEPDLQINITTHGCGEHWGTATERARPGPHRDRFQLQSWIFQAFRSHAGTGTRAQPHPDTQCGGQNQGQGCQRRGRRAYSPGIPPRHGDPAWNR